jgi:PAS domain-containing protein
MTQGIQDTLLQLFESVRHDPESLPIVPLEGWQEGSAEWRLLESFRGMVEQMQERIYQLKQAEEQLREREELYHSVFDATCDGLFIGDLDVTIVEAHYFTRNRTRGSVFPSVFLRAWEVPTIAPRCFRLLFWQQERIALGRWTGTISHEAGLLGAADLPA